MAQDTQTTSNVTQRLQQAGQQALTRDYVKREEQVMHAKQSPNYGDFGHAIVRGMHRVGSSVRRQPLRWLIIGGVIGCVAAVAIIRD